MFHFNWWTAFLILTLFSQINQPEAVFSVKHVKCYHFYCRLAFVLKFYKTHEERWQHFLYLLSFSRTTVVTKCKAYLVPFYLCFDSLPVTGCMRNISRLGSDLSCFSGYRSDLNDELLLEPMSAASCQLTDTLTVLRSHASSLRAPAKTKHLCCAANKKVSAKTNQMTFNISRQLNMLCRLFMFFVKWNSV